MAVIDRLVVNAQAMSSTNLDSVAAGSDGVGPTLLVRKVDPVVKALSATVVVDAETNTITLTPVWQVSNDASTWKDVYPVNNAAYVAMATGTAGADATVTRVITAPDAVFSYRYCRCNVRVGVTTGTTNDTYTVSYNYIRA